MALSKLLRISFPSLQIEETAFDWNARWACYNPQTAEVLVVGDSGRIKLLAKGGQQNIRTETSENLRCASFSRDGSAALVVGNRGTLLPYVRTGPSVLVAPVDENLRRVVWDPEAPRALIVGNGGAAFYYYPSGPRFQVLEGAQNNLRGAAWPHSNNSPLIVGNAFAGPFIPSPNIYTVEDMALTPAAQIDKVDLIGVGWNEKKKFGLMVGYELVWHEPRILLYRDRPEEIRVEDEGIYPTAVAFHPQQDMAIIGTGHPDRSPKRAAQIIMYREGKLTKLKEMSGFGCTSVEWAPDGSEASLVTSRIVRTFNT